MLQNWGLTKDKPGTNNFNIMKKTTTFDALKRSNDENHNLSSGTSSQIQSLSSYFRLEGHGRDKKGTFRFMNDIFTKPVIRRYKDKWFVEYYYKNPLYLINDSAKEFERFKVYELINRYEGQAQEDYARDLRDAVELNLQHGYNPYRQEIILMAEKDNAEKERIESESDKMRGEKINILLDRYLAHLHIKGLTQKSIQSYTTPITHFKKWLAGRNWTDRGVKEFTESDIKSFLSEMQIEKKWSGRTYNSIRDYVKMWFDWFELEKYIDLTPITRRLQPQKTVSTKNEDYHGRARVAMKEALASDPLMERVCNVIYYSALRSYMELSQVTVGDIDLDNRVIKIKESVGKTGYRFVPICDELHQIFMDMKLKDYPLNYYLFGEKGQISPVRLYKNFLSKRYYELRKRAGLSPEYTMYSWKHTRVVDLKNAGYSDAEIQDLTGHKDSKSYDAYARNFGLRLNSKLKGKTMEF